MPVIVNTTPDYQGSLNALKSASACFLPQCLGEEDRLAIEIIVRMRELAVVPGGTNYNLATLEVAAKQWLHSLSKDERQALSLYLDLQNAMTEGAQFPYGTSINGLKRDAKCALCLGTEAKRNLILFLKWKLNTLNEPE